jgi:hypothetical protein
MLHAFSVCTLLIFKIQIYLFNKPVILYKASYIFTQKNFLLILFKERYTYLFTERSKNNGGFPAFSYDRSSSGKQSTSFGHRIINSAINDTLSHTSLYETIFHEPPVKIRKWRAEISEFIDNKNTKIFRISSSNWIFAGISQLAHVLIDSPHKKEVHSGLKPEQSKKYTRWQWAEQNNKVTKVFYGSSS